MNIWQCAVFMDVGCVMYCVGMFVMFMDGLYVCDILLDTCYVYCCLMCYAVLGVWFCDVFMDVGVWYNV